MILIQVRKEMNQENKFSFVNSVSETKRLEAELKEFAEQEEQSTPIEVSKRRLGVLSELRDKCHSFYMQPSTLPVIGRKSWLKYLSEIYVPNVMRDFPYLLDKVFTLFSVIESLEKELVETKKQRNNAYKKLGWKISKHSDQAEITIEDLSEFFDDEDEE